MRAPRTSGWAGGRRSGCARACAAPSPVATATRPTACAVPRMPDAALPELALPRENVCGHTRKVILCREACERLRQRRAGGSLRILDVGCGSGYAVTRFLGAPGDDVLGIDLYEPNISYARRTFERPGLRFECRDAQSLVGDQQGYDIET